MEISTAIQNMTLLSFNYDGYRRVVEPHTLGVDSKGHKALCAYQVSGGSSSGDSRGWRFFHVGEMRNVTALPETFASARSGYRRGDTRFTTIYAQL